GAGGRVFEVVDAVRQHERGVVGKGRDAGAEPDGAGALGRGGDEPLGRGDDLVAGRVVLADPGLVVAELVQPLDQLEVAAQRQVGVLVHRVEGGHEDPEAQAGLEHGGSSWGACRAAGRVAGCRRLAKGAKRRLTATGRWWFTGRMANKSRPGRRSQAESTRTRARLLDRAERLFARKGYRGMSLRELARACGVAPFTIQHHFGS